MLELPFRLAALWDDILADGIRAACQNAGPDGRVVAVLGLLCVNGIAHRLLCDKKLQEQQS